MSIRCFLLVMLLAAGGCDETPIAASSPGSATPARLGEPVPSPSGDGAGEPFLAPGNDSVLMSWIEPSTSGHAVHFARFRDGAWSDPVTIVDRADLFVNWADFPSVVETPSGVMYAHWLQKSGDETYAYDVNFSISTDQGHSWSDPAVLHTDGVVTEHGFVSLVPEGDGTGTVGAVWLDGRKMAGGHGGEGSMTLRFARIHRDGTVTDRAELDDRVCECCQTSMTKTDAGFVAVYRNRSEEEIRDIAVVRETPDGWTEPAIVHEDGWEIAGCPVNGPQIDSSGSAAGVAWATGADEMDRVFAAFSEDGATTFGDRIRIDEGGAIGRVDTVILDDGSMLVVWLGQQDGEGRILARRVQRSGEVSPVRMIGSSSSSRAAGFPRMAKLGDVVYVAWTVPGEPSEIRLAAFDIREIS